MGREIPVEQCKSDLELHGLTQCAQCGELLHQQEAHVAVYYKDNMQEQEHFCNRVCEEHWRFDKSRVML